jgi:hypothetical protein
LTLRNIFIIGQGQRKLAENIYFIEGNKS